MFWGIATDGHGNAMELLNFTLSQTGLFLTMLLCFKYLMRRIARRSKRQSVKKADLGFRKLHIIMGVALIGIGLVHGMLSADDVRSFFFGWGFLVWILLVLIALNYCLRKYLKKHWLLIHQLLAWLISAAAVVHLVIETIYNSSELL